MVQIYLNFCIHSHQSIYDYGTNRICFQITQSKFPMKYLSQNWLINRRHLLRGAGVSLALPLLDVMKPLRAKPSDAKQPRRCIFIYLPNGVNTIDFQVTETGKDYKFSKILKPLEKHRADITPISGLYHPHGLGHHHNCQKIWLTGGKIGTTERNTISVDQLMAMVTSEETRIHSLELSNRSSALSWTADGIQLPAQNNPSVVFKRLFEVPPGGLEQQRRGLHRKGSILDAVLDDARDLDAQLGQEDKGRLEQYLTAVREVEIRTERADAWLDTPLPEVDKATRSKLDRNVSTQQVGDYFRTMYDLVVLAFQTDMTRVATFSSGSEGQGLPIPEININQDRHSLSHHNGNPKRMADLTASDTFNAQQFAYLVGRLAETEDANGPLLDTTMALWGSGMAFGHSHGNANLPLVLAGGSKLGLKHGSHIDYNKKMKDFAQYSLSNPAEHYKICFNPVNGKAHMSNLLLTMAQKMGVETDTFADSNETLQEIQA